MKHRRLLTHPFVTDSFWYGLSSLLVNVLNYSFLLLVIHFLSKSTFGAFNALVSILTLAAFLTNPLQLHVTKEVANIIPAKLRAYCYQGNRKILTFAGGALLVLAALSVPLASALNVSTGDLVFTWVVAVSLILATFANGVSAGLRKLVFQASLNSFATIVKLFLAWLMFTTGFGVIAGLSGYLAGFSLTAGLTWAMLGRWETSGWTPPAAAGRKEEVAVLLLAYLFVALPFSLDQILVQVLNPTISGDYAALATLGKLVFFASSPFQVVLYSYLVKARNDGATQMKYFLSGALAAIGAALLVTLFLWAGGRTLVGLLLTSTYLEVSKWVLVYSLGICGYVFSYSVVLLGIVRNDGRVVWLISLASLAQIVLFSLRNATLGQFVTNQVVCMALLCAASISYLLLGAPRQGSEARA